MLPEYEEIIPHEVGHYYFNRGPQWLTEGAAELMRAYVHDNRGVERIAARSSTLASELPVSCSGITRYPIENIWHYLFVQKHRGSTIALPSRCIYGLGENFLLSVRSLIGDEALSSALNRLYLLHAEDEVISEDRVYEALLGSTPSEKRNAFVELYRRLHGGPSSDPSRESADDHSDSWSSATAIGLDEDRHGSFDYAADLDFFRFQAEEGHRYTVTLDHDSVGASGISVFTVVDSTLSSLDSNLATDFALTPSGPRVLLLAPTSGDYYFSVQNFNGAPGDYTVRVSAADIPGDSGNTPSTADEISVGTVVHAAIDDAVDFDYFRFSAEAGQRYRITAMHPRITMSFFVFSIDEHNRRTHVSSLQDSAIWTAPVDGVYYIQITRFSLGDLRQPYTVSIALE